MNTPLPLGDRLRRRFPGSSPGASPPLAEGLLAEGLEPRILYSAAPVELTSPLSAGPSAESIQCASHPSTFAVSLLPLSEVATLHGGIVTVNPAAGSDAELVAAMAHETAHSVDSQIEDALLRSLFEPIAE